MQRELLDEMARSNSRAIAFTRTGPRTSGNGHNIAAESRRQ